MSLYFEIPGQPCAKQRARIQLNKKTGKSFGRTPENTVKYENLVKTCFAAKYPEFQPIEEGQPLSLLVIAYWPIPKAKLKKFSEQTPRPSQPDWDNVGKIISDALNQIAWHDDRQIVRAVVTKLYSPRPRVEVWIEPFNFSQMCG